MPEAPLTPVDRGYILARHEDGWSQSKIARRLNGQRVAQWKLQYARRKDVRKPTGPSQAAVSMYLRGQTYPDESPDANAKRKAPRKAAKRGRPRCTDAAEDTKVPMIVATEDAKYPDRNVPASHMVKKWATKNRKSAKTFIRRAQEVGMGPQTTVKKKRLTQKQKDARIAWGKKHRRISKRTWETKMFAIDEKRYKFHSLPSARRNARAMSKTIQWGPSDIVGTGYTRPCGLKHRESEQGVNVLMGVGDGGRAFCCKVLKARLSGKVYADLVKKTIAPQVRKLGKSAFLLRDNDPGSHCSRKGLAAEKEAKIIVRPQAIGSPDTNPEDVHHWNWVNTQVMDEEREWEHDHPGKDWKETIDEFKARVVWWSKKLPAGLVRSTARSLHRRAKELAEGDGDWISGD